MSFPGGRVGMASRIRAQRVTRGFSGEAPLVKHLFGVMRAAKQVSIKISKKQDKIFGNDLLNKTKNYSNPLIYCIRFHIYPDIKIVKTKAGNSILISLSNGEGWRLKSDTNNFRIEKNIFLGNKNKIMNSESISISGAINAEIISVKWIMERIS